MTRVFNDPADFAEEALSGFVNLYSGHVKQVTGGVVRRHPGPASKVAVIFGGGSGHYPAFAGLVGPGFGDGAVVGNIFTSPSSQFAYTVARQAHRGGGVIFSYGNYAGDVMNFGLATELLVSEGIAARNVIVTDDILSAPPSERGKRRGIAGDFVVFKVLGAAAETGADIDEVERLGNLANDLTRTVGVAFSGCTFPGASEPLFEVAPGFMAVGLGIHGESGLETVPLMPAKQLAALLVEKVITEAPEGAGTRVAVVLNGLGSSKYEELFLLWNDIVPLLAGHGLTVIEPEVGELVTSLDMAGISLTITWLTDDLEPLWRAAVDTPAYRKGGVITSGGGVDEDEASDAVAVEVLPAASLASCRASEVIVTLMAIALDAVRAHEDELARIDAVAGDGDHGRGMVRGLEAAAAEAERVAGAGAGAGTTLALAGEAWAAQAGGTSGVLWGTALRAAGAVIGDVLPVDRVVFSAAVEAFADSLLRLGKAELGDKTMLDAILPYRDEVARAVAAGHGLAEISRLGAQAAEDGAQRSADLVPKVGRARPHADKSVGTPDAGATSFALIVRAATGTTAGRIG